MNQSVKEAKLAYYTETIKDSKDNKTVFKLTNTLFHNNKAVSLPAHEDPKLSNEFAQYFQEKIDKIRQTFPTTASASVPNAPSTAAKLPEFTPIAPEELRKSSRKEIQNHVVSIPYPPPYSNPA